MQTPESARCPKELPLPPAAAPSEAETLTLRGASQVILRAIRPAKGLWRRSDAGQITNLPGAGAPYEPPLAPARRVQRTHLSAAQAARQVLAELDEQGFWPSDS